MALGALPNHWSCPLADPAPGRDGLVNSWRIMVWRIMVWRSMVGGALPLPGIILQAMSSPSPLGHHGSWQGGSYRLGCWLSRRQFLDGIPLAQVVLTVPLQAHSQDGYCWDSGHSFHGSTGGHNSCFSSHSSLLLLLSHLSSIPLEPGWGQRF